ncbi:hypothetical protein Bbelb_018300 [Branchiostoma belcheri]|nr:hypothetical protein Bbelb_018300 [Branchiostoma belcheri]
MVNIYQDGRSEAFQNRISQAANLLFKGRTRKNISGADDGMPTRSPGTLKYLLQGRPTVPSRCPTKASLPIHIKNTSTSQQMAEMSGTRRPCTTEQVHEALIADKTRAWNSEQMLNTDLSFYLGSLWSEASDTEAPTVRDLRDQSSLTNRVDKQLEEIFGSTSKSKKRPTYRRETDTSSSPPRRSPLPAVSRKPSSVRRVRHVSSTDRSFSPPPHLSSSRRHVSPGKEKPIVIGKSANPRCFQNMRQEDTASPILQQQNSVDDQDDPVRYELRHLKEATTRAKHKRTRAFQFANEFFMENTTNKGIGREVWQMMQTREERRFAEEAEKAAATLRGASEPPVRPLQYPTWDHASQPPPFPWGGRPSRGRSPPRGRHSHNAAQ